MLSENYEIDTNNKYHIGKNITSDWYTDDTVIFTVRHSYIFCSITGINRAFLINFYV